MPILDANSLEFISRSPEQTRRVGMRLGAMLEVGDTVCLEGELGSGKTTLVQGIASGWGSLDAVSSPTFVLINIYRRADGQRLAHMDAYRMDSPIEAEALDLADLLEAGPLIVEWAPRIADALPEERFWLQLRTIDEEQRAIQISAHGGRYESLIDHLQEAMFGVA
jgi:tRNA threonylcarbamoyladenosine biosynthesis protein TsaE